MSTTVVTHKTIPLSLIDTHARNYRKHPPAQLERLRASLIRFSQVRSIVVQAKEGGRYRILAGHGVASAALECGILKLHCNVVPDNWDEGTCNAYLVADNEVERGVDLDNQLLAELLKEQVDAGYSLDALGIQEKEFTDLLQILQESDRAVPSFAELEEEEEDVRQSMTLPQGRTADIVNSKNINQKGDGVAFGRDPKQWLQQYETTMLRQIVLIYKSDEYTRVLTQFMAIRRQNNLETNADVVGELLSFYLKSHPELEEEAKQYASSV
jgi:hypothetical protein